MLRLVPYVTNTKKAMFAMPNAPSIHGVGRRSARLSRVGREYATEATRPFWMLWNRKPEGDVPYVMAAIDEAVATAAQNNVIVDWSKIYVYGLANGAFMAHRLLFQHPCYRFTGRSTRSCHTAERRTPWWPGSEESARLVAEWNQCNLESPLTTESRLNTNPFFSYAVTSTRYEGCASNNVVEEWRVHGMDHLPGIAGGGLVEVSRKAVDWLLDESAVSAST
ncbi:phospholipase/carboxylesterase/thioesterase domain-containing protein [Pseudoscourfieldia marina]